jgi:hypothetical protein
VGVVAAMTAGAVTVAVAQPAHAMYAGSSHHRTQRNNQENPHVAHTRNAPTYGDHANDYYLGDGTPPPAYRARIHDQSLHQKTILKIAAKAHQGLVDATLAEAIELVRNLVTRSGTTIPPAMLVQRENRQILMINSVRNGTHAVEVVDPSSPRGSYEITDNSFDSWSPVFNALGLEGFTGTVKITTSPTKTTGQGIPAQLRDTVLDHGILNVDIYGSDLAPRGKVAVELLHDYIRRLPAKSRMKFAHLNNTWTVRAEGDGVVIKNKETNEVVRITDLNDQDQWDEASRILRLPQSPRLNRVQVTEGRDGVQIADTVTGLTAHIQDETSEEDWSTALRSIRDHSSQNTHAPAIADYEIQSMSKVLADRAARDAKKVGRGAKKAGTLAAQALLFTVVTGGTAPIFWLVGQSIRH